MQGVIDTIEFHLTAASQKDPEGSVIKTWTRDLQHRLGAISPERLEKAFILAREEASIRRGQGRFGQLILDDVVRQYRKVPSTVEAVPEDPHCPHFCDKGHLMMIDRDDYEVQAPCSCRAGEHQRTRLKIYDGRRNADELLRMGWKLKPQARKLSHDEIQWLMARSFEAGITGALWEKRNDRQGTPRAENWDRAAVILSRSIGRG